MANPKELKYSKSHEWVEFLEGNQAVVGLTDYAQEHLGDIVFVNLPQVGDRVMVGDTACDVESVKAVSDVYAPVEGVVVQVNEELEDSPSKINEEPFEAWLFKLEEIGATEELLTQEEYMAFCQEEEE